MSRRRRVDWPLILGPGPDTPAPKVVEQAVRGQLAVLLSAFDDILALENRDAILRQAVEVARGKIGLDAGRDLPVRRIAQYDARHLGIGPARRASSTSTRSCIR